MNRLTALVKANVMPPLQGFVRQPSRDIVLESSDPAELIDRLEKYSPPTSIIKVH